MCIATQSTEDAIKQRMSNFPDLLLYKFGISLLYNWQMKVYWEMWFPKYENSGMERVSKVITTTFN